MMFFGLYSLAELNHSRIRSSSTTVPRIAVVGAGTSGFYAAHHILKVNANVRVIGIDDRHRRLLLLLLLLLLFLLLLMF